MNTDNESEAIGKPENTNNNNALHVRQLYKTIYEFNHKLLQPMQVIMGHAQLLAMESSENSSQFKRLNIIIAQIAKIKDMNSDLRLTAQAHEEQMES